MFSGGGLVGFLPSLRSSLAVQRHLSKSASKLYVDTPRFEMQRPSLGSSAVINAAVTMGCINSLKDPHALQLPSVFGYSLTWVDILAFSLALDAVLCLHQKEVATLAYHMSGAAFGLFYSQIGPTLWDRTRRLVRRNPLTPSDATETQQQNR